MAANNTLRYSDQELAVFKEIIDAKLFHAKEQLAQLQDQIIEGTENSSDAHGADWMDDSSLHAELEMLNNMAIRQRKYIKELENALIRIDNKIYGVCMVTGDLIDKRRLMAVPITTKSLAAKNALRMAKPSRRPSKTNISAHKEGGKIISKIKPKPSPKISKPSLLIDEDDLLSTIDTPPIAEEIPFDQMPDPEEMD